ncbi:hypothetical protein [Mycobacterium kyogaense]|uniref:hypothetical protein n=1 Tax=Mycobacterium kyogaense TaxID=2212479 RepID=UPI0013C525C0|nr:hypothetical protein [Mycobacterium kyogaense]
MSVSSRAPRVRKLPEEVENELLKYSPIASVRTIDGAVDYFKNDLHIEISKNALFAAVSHREVDHVRRANALYFSPRALLRWFMEGLRTEESA